MTGADDNKNSKDGEGVEDTRGGNAELARVDK